MVKRDHTLDFLRVLSMFLVVVIHVANCYGRQMAVISDTSYFFSVFFNSIARVSVPIFFMISGALLIGKDHTKEKYLSRIKKMIIVLVIWTSVYLLWEFLFLGIKPDNIFDLLFTPARAHLWFMYAIIGIYIALPFISKMVKNLTKQEENLFIILWLFFSGFCHLLTLIIGTNIEYPVPIISGTYYLGYFIIGYILYNRIKKYKGKKDLKEYNKLLILTFVVANAIIIIFSLTLADIQGYNYKKLLRYADIFLVLSSLSVYIFTLINMKKEYKIITLVAPYAFGIYLVHGIFLDILKKVVDLYELPSIITIPLFALVLFIISYFVIKGLKKVPIIKDHIC